MSTQINKSPSPLMWVAGISVILFSIVGIGAFMGWIPSSIGNSGDKVTLSSAAGDKATSSSAAGVKAQTAQKHVANKTYVANNTRSKVICAECGVIQSLREIVQPGDGGAVGIVGGAVVGGLLGNQVGGGRGKDLATVAGAVGGAMAGNEVQKRMETAKRYEIVVRFEDGSSRVYTETNQTAWRAGDHVKVVNGELRSNN